MANIVVATYNTLGKEGGIFPYIESFLNGLKDSGNNILYFEKTDVERNISKKIPNKYLQMLKNFNPDLFIIFNNQFWDISSFFDVPIVIYGIDSTIAFANVDNLINNDRYKHFYIAKSERDKHRDILRCPEKNMCYIPPFTGVVPADEEIKRNIGFCGSHWLGNTFNEVFNFILQDPSDEDRKIAKKVWEKYIETPYLHPEEIYKINNYKALKYLKADNLYIFSTRISGLKRARYLLAVDDLGLEIRGIKWNNPNCHVLKAFPELILSYSSEKILNTQTTADFYNSSKIGFCVNHIQAATGFSWRVCDVLASNACLVSEKKKDLLEFGFDIPTFETPEEARAQCKKILDNENLRKDIIYSAHEVIEKNHRFNNILPIMENFLNMNLHSDNIGKIEKVKLNKTNNNLDIRKRISNKIVKYLCRNL